MKQNDDEERKRLSPIQYSVTRQKATERPFTGEFWDHFEPGCYRCICCGEPLFSSQTKFDAGCGWPSFYQPISKQAVAEAPDVSHAMVRTEIVCSHCDAHLGHVFEDGPAPTGLRYCVNSASLRFDCE